MGFRADDRDGSCKEILSGKLKGKWRVQFTAEDELYRKTRISRVFPTKTEAKEFLRSLRHGERVEAAQRKKELTLAGWFDWLAENDWPENLDEKTVAIRKGQFERHVRPVLGGVPLGKIDPMAVRAFYRELREKGVGEPTVLAVKRTLVRVFNQAVSPYGRVSMNQANPFRLVLSAPALREAVAITPEEAARALACAALTPKERAMLAVYLLAGLRLSEQMALTRGQIRFGQGLITVDRAVRLDTKGGQTVGLPKGGKRRSTAMCPSLEAALRPVCEGLEADAYLWSAENGNKPKMKVRTYDVWESVLAKTGLPGDMSPHDGRLTHVNWIEKLLPEVSPTTLKEHVGHAGSGVTEVNYTRPLTPAQDLLRKGLERLIVPP